MGTRLISWMEATKVVCCGKQPDIFLHHLIDVLFFQTSVLQTCFIALLGKISWKILSYGFPYDWFRASLQSSVAWVKLTGCFWEHISGVSQSFIKLRHGKEVTCTYRHESSPVELKLTRPTSCHWQITAYIMTAKQHSGQTQR